MGKLTKILAPIVAVLAVVACVMSILAYREYLKYKARSVKLATCIVEATGKLDELSDSKTPEKVTFTPGASGAKEAGTISYPENRKDTTALDTGLDAVRELAAKIVKQRNDMADTLSDLSVSLKNTQMPREALYKLDTYADKLTLAKNYAAAIYSMDDEFAAKIEAYSRIVGANVSILRTPQISGINATKANNSAALRKVEDAISNLLKQKNAYEASIKAIEVVISRHTFTSGPKNINQSNYVQKLQALRKDLSNVNQKLIELENVKRELNAAKATISEQKQQIAKLNSELNSVKAERDALKAEAELVKNVDANGNPIKPKAAHQKITLDQIDPDTRGVVLLENKQWEFVIANLGDDKLAQDANVIISHNGTYLASGKVSYVEESISMIEITRRECKEIPAGATILMGTNKK